MRSLALKKLVGCMTVIFSFCRICSQYFCFLPFLLVSINYLFFHGRALLLFLLSTGLWRGSIFVPKFSFEICRFLVILGLLGVKKKRFLGNFIAIHTPSAFFWPIVMKYRIGTRKCPGSFVQSPYLSKYLLKEFLFSQKKSLLQKKSLYVTL